MKIKVGIVLWLTIVIIIVTIVGFSMSLTVSDYFKNTVLQRDVHVSVKFIELQAKQHLTSEDFTAKDYEIKDKIFREFFNEISTDEIVRIKVWSIDKTVVYSDLKEEVGKVFLNNNELDEALDGEIRSEISDLTKSDNTSEKEHKQLMETYIPIRSDSGNVIGVIETYTSMKLVNTYIDNANQNIFIIGITGIILVSLIIALAFSSMRNNLINPILGISRHTKKIQMGDLDIKSELKGYDEIRKLGNDVEIMASKLREQRGELINAARLSAIGQLSVRLAHDLRNPLSIILNSVALMKHKYGLTPKDIESFDRIDRSVLRMTHQIDNVMDFVSTKELNLDTKPLNEIIKNAIKNAAIPDNIKINLPSNDIILTCDSDKLRVVFDNILVNAKHAISRSGIIDIRTSQDQNRVKIEIQDSGSGIPADILPNIFEPLFTTKQEGTGLGLSACKNIVELHNGTIDVKTELGKGTTFTITVPIILTQKQTGNLMIVSRI